MSLKLWGACAAVGFLSLAAPAQAFEFKVDGGAGYVYLDHDSGSFADSLAAYKVRGEGCFGDDTPKFCVGLDWVSSFGDEEENTTIGNLAVQTTIGFWSTGAYAKAQFYPTSFFSVEPYLGLRISEVEATAVALNSLASASETELGYMIGADFDLHLEIPMDLGINLEAGAINDTVNYFAAFGMIGFRF